MNNPVRFYKSKLTIQISLGLSFSLFVESLHHNDFIIKDIVCLIVEASVSCCSVNWHMAQSIYIDHVYL